MNNVYAVIMAGGSGTRFWPLSRAARPKQLVRVLGDATMIQATVARLQPAIPAERVLVVTTAALAEETRRQLPMLAAEHIIAEPMGRDTAACVCLAALVVQRLDPQGVMILLPADQVIGPADAFQAALAAGVQVAASGALVTYGVMPRFAATGYGYIEVGALRPAAGSQQVNQVVRFVEKPDADRAAEYLAAGRYRWNSGIFTWRADVVLRELAAHCPWLTQALAPVGAAFGTPDFVAALAMAYGPLRKVSIDYALMEHATDIAVVTATFAWDDVGSWDALYDHLPQDGAGLIARGPTLTRDCDDSLLVSETGQLIAAIGVHGLTVVATADAILVVPKGRSQEVKHLVDALKAEGRDGLV